MEDGPPAVIIDNGSDSCKVGVSGEDAPRSCFPSIIARQNDTDSESESESAIFIGNSAMNKSDADFTISRPVQYRQITCWEDIEYLWRYCFDVELGLKPEDQPILLTEAPLTNKADREKMTHTVFEELKAPAFYVGMQPLLALYSTGCTPGIVIDCGHEVTHIMPIFEGHAFPKAIRSIDFGGLDVTQNLKLMLQDKQLDLQTVRNIKEKLCYAKLGSYSDEMAASKQVEYTLPDGQVTEINSEYLWRSSEALFNPSSYGKQGFKSLQDLVYDSIRTCSYKFRDDLYRNIILSGGSTLFSGFAERLEKEMLGLTSRVKIVVPAERKISTWIGGSILASLTSFQPMWISKSEYDEIGPPIVHRKCF